MPAADRGPRSRLKIVVGSVALATSLLLTTLYLVPIAADRLVPLIPYSWEQRFSQGLNEQVQKMFSAKPCREPAGLAALARLSAQLVAAANLPVPANIAVLDSPVKNAITLPGGKVYLFNGLLQFAQEPDEIAGVLAHELGHVAGRDGLKQLIETGGSSFLLGLLFGDIAGGSTVALGGRLLVDNAHTRQSERAADATSARIMTALGRSAVTMARFLTRVTASSDSGRDIALLRSHPLSAERLATLEKLSRPATGPALLSAAEWTALKAICR